MLSDIASFAILTLLNCWKFQRFHLTLILRINNKYFTFVWLCWIRVGTKVRLKRSDLEGFSYYLHCGLIYEAISSTLYLSKLKWGSMHSCYSHIYSRICWEKITLNNTVKTPRIGEVWCFINYILLLKWIILLNLIRINV